MPLSPGVATSLTQDLCVFACAGLPLYEPECAWAKQHALQSSMPSMTSILYVKEELEVKTKAMSPVASYQLSHFIIFPFILIFFPSTSSVIALPSDLQSDCSFY